MAKTRAFYIVILLLSVAAVVVLGSWASFLALYALLLLPLAALATLLLYPSMVWMRPECERRAFVKGEEMPFTLTIRNHSIFTYPNVDLTLESGDLLHAAEEADADPDQPLSLPPRYKAQRQYRLRFPYRGVYTLGVKQARVTDFLGLFRLRFKPGRTVRVTVYPKLIEGFAIPQSPRQMSEGSEGYDRFSEQMADVSDVRKHNPNDDFRQIHWKLTAKRGEFIVKNHRTPGLARTAIVLDTSATGLPGRMQVGYEDQMASLAATALDCCIKNRQAARLIYGPMGDDMLDVVNPEDMEKALGLLAVLSFDREAGGLAQMLSRLLLLKQSLTGLVVFAARVDEAVQTLLKEAVTVGHNVTLYYVYSAQAAPTREDYDRLDALSAFGIQVEILK